ncbi:MAG: GTP-binding protein TypA/BipA [Myxococcota bacterium]|nr:GTP-binding protein TypA/BipA [Myxococcota bacterium]
MSSSSRRDPSKIRNIAIIAHVDHGKTTLVDKLLGQSGSFRRGEGQQDRVMDSNDIERERGITILAKCTAIEWGGYHINIVDTPGHADFGGEVERILGMVDCALLLVDAFEGPMPQTRFVTRKALERGLRPILVVNKIDRPGSDPDGAVNGVFDLFVSLHATDEQLDFPIVFASAKNGYAIRQLGDEPRDLTPLYETIVARAPPPRVELDGPPAFQVITFDYDSYLGSMAIGRVQSGAFRPGQKVMLARLDGSRQEFAIQKILGFHGLQRFELDEAGAGDIVTMTGMDEVQVGETITIAENPRILPPLKVDPPTVSMTFMANNSPKAGSEGKYFTSRQLRDRLLREVKSNVSLQVSDTESPDAFEVRGRGELHISVLIETMRREGYELMVSQPQVVMRQGPNGPEEPWLYVMADVESAHVGTVIESISKRLGRLQSMNEAGGRTRLEFVAPTRGMIGYRSQFLTETRGTGILNSVFHGYEPFAGELKRRGNGALVVLEPCKTVTYALWNLQDRGVMFLGPGEEVYAGQIIGQHTRDNDLIINPGKAKKLTNIRSAGADEKNFLVPPRIMGIEESLEWINPDELVEVTPKAVRIRKRILDHNERKRYDKSQSAMLDE